nr:Putative NTP pyrophosphohydrolase [uncultured Mediterranean phage uvMED]BAR25303.1 Putative NTP pyrophosphohydrolase [uncultured Mediterranean phage uvMED]
MIEEVNAFLTKFGLNYKGTPITLHPTVKADRIKHMQEEISEYSYAKNKEEELDAIIDIIYLAIGTGLMHGFDIEEAFKRVHQANMKRIRNPVLTDKGGIFKPKGWVAPDLKDLVK